MSATTSPFGVLSFPHLFVPRAPSPGAEERFSMSVIFDEDAQATPEFKAMKKAVMDCAKEKWGANAENMIKNGQIRMPFRDGAEKSYDGYGPGKVFVNPWSKQKPGVIDGRLNDMDASDIYPGCVGRFTYNVFAYDNSGNRGVSFGLNNVQITDLTTPRLDGRVAANKEFDATDMTVADMGINDDDDDDFPF